jgi:hypothetical protein
MVDRHKHVAWGVVACGGQKVIELILNRTSRNLPNRSLSKDAQSHDHDLPDCQCWSMVSCCCKGALDYSVGYDDYFIGTKTQGKAFNRVSYPK